MSPEVKALVEAAKAYMAQSFVFRDVKYFNTLIDAIAAVEALDTPAARHQAALDRGHEWDNDFGQQDIKMGR